MSGGAQTPAPPGPAAVSGPAVSPGPPRVLPHPLLWSLASIAVLLAAWHVAALRLPPIILPSIDSTVAACARLLAEPATWVALGASLGTFLAGFVIAAAVGALIGVATGLSAAVRGAFAPVLGLLGSVPTVAWMGLAMIWFGLGMGPTVFLVVATTTPILASALARAVSDRDQRFEELADVFELPSGARMRHVTLPPLLGSAQAALSAMAGLGWKLTVMGEFLTASRGLGELLVEAKAHLQTDRVIAITVLLVIVWAVIDLVLRAATGARTRARRSRGAGTNPDPRPAPAVIRAHDPAPSGRDRGARDPEPLLRCRDVALGYDSVVARGLSFSVRPGRVTAVLGASGIGKSSLLHVLGGLRAPLAGAVDRREGLRTSYVFQDDRLLPWRTVEQNVALLSAAPLPRARQQLAALGVADAADRMPDELSGGMRRRAALARGFLRDAELLLLDEPFAGLDPRRRAALIDDIERMRRQRDRAIVFVTHDVDDAMLLADEALVLGIPDPPRPARSEPSAGETPAAEVVARVDLSGLGPSRTAGDPAAAALRARLLSALVGAHPHPTSYS